MKQATFIIGLTILVNAFLISCHTKQQALSHLDANLSVDQRVEALLAQMTLEEKVAQVCSRSLRASALIEEGHHAADTNLLSAINQGIGQIDNTFDERTPVQSANECNMIQQYLIDNTRLKIPTLIGSECLHGHAGTSSTIFPSPLAMACSWNPELVNQAFDIAGREARLRGCHEAHTPVLDLGRDPRWGRIEETYGEDTYLVTEMGMAAVCGLQGGQTGNPGYTHVVSSAKHFAGYGQVVGGRNFAPTPIDMKTLYDEVLPPFEAIVKQCKAQGMMASHCEVNGIPAHGNHWLLTSLLKDQWGFTGMVVSDYMDIKRLEEFHHVAETPQAAARMALMAGMDMDLPVGAAYSHLTEVICREPELEVYLDESVRRILRLKFMLGLFENPFVDTALCARQVGCQDHVAVAQELANQSIVLLKNDNNILPLDANKLNSVAVIGPNATSLETGTYTCSNDQVISILEGIRQGVGSQLTVNYAEGCQIAKVEVKDEAKHMSVLTAQQEQESIQAAVEIAKQSDVAIVCVGGKHKTSREATYWKGDKGDRSTLTLLGNQNLLIERIKATGTPVVLVLMGGRPYAIPQIAQQADAILSTFFLGQCNGRAVYNVLFAEVNPSGKLAVSMPRSVGQLPVYYSQKATAFYKDYLEETSRPLYAFGHGLSYTSFEFSKLQVEKQNISAQETYKFNFTISNTGTMAGAEVAQVYFRDQVASIPRPERLLVRFRKVYLEPGESTTLFFELDPPKDLSFTSVNNLKVLENGSFELMVGNASDNILLRQIFYIKN